MTRASLLQILDHVSEISDAEIRELEQLAAAFPYCQTAHILLAKAAHDRGSMLASQRLRRAATYATNRELLRQLLEQPAPVALANAPTQPENQVPASALNTANADAVTLPAEALPAETEDTSNLPAASSAEVVTPNSIEAEPTTEFSSEISAESETASTEVLGEVAEQHPAADHQPGEEASNLFEVAIPTLEEPTPTATLPDQVYVERESPQTQDTEAQLATEQSTEPSESAEQDSEAFTPSTAKIITEESDTEQSVHSTEALEADAPSGLEQLEAAEAVVAVETLGNDLLPPTAPPIRPPANAGISRFEFDLVEPALPAPSAYRLPGLEDESEDEDLPLPTISKVELSAFHADKDLGYALGIGSRLGYDLQPHDGYTLDLPLDAFFEPDALLLAHMAASRPKPTKSSIDLINRFLQAQPRIKTSVSDNKSADEQTDLSVRSTQAAPAIASESLAKIMVKQGKTDKAIEIYERLMQRQPEKKAYFADQIQQLKQPSA